MSKTANGQRNHEKACHSYAALNYDAQAYSGGLLPPLPISKSQANRIQALTNDYNSSTVPVKAAAAATKPGAEPQPPTPINGKKKNKTRQKKRAKLLEENDSSAVQHTPDTQKDAAEADQQATTCTAGVHGRPGKKMLRRMRYLQSQGSPIDHLLYCAQSSCFTHSVTLVQEVPTALSNAATAPANDGGRSSMTTDIRVQPLIVLDLNGILCHRIRKNDTTVTAAAGTSTRKMVKTDYRPVAFDIANTPVIPRTDITRFLRYMDQHFCLAVWTSAKNKTAKAMVKHLFPLDVANRLLFIWDQKDCDTVTTVATSTTCRNNNTKENSRQHPVDIVFVKDLAKVWKQYPLWNANNTILMDDSPDKCTQWHENAVHPPPLHGLLCKDDDKTAMFDAAITNEQHQQYPHLMSDEENERRQQLFFEGLVHYWKNHCMTITFEEEEEECRLIKTTTKVINQQQQGVSLVVSAESGEEPLKNDNNDDYSKRTNANNGLVEFLKIHAVGHMGWE